MVWKKTFLRNADNQLFTKLIETNCANVGYNAVLAIDESRVQISPTAPSSSQADYALLPLSAKQ